MSTNRTPAQIVTEAARRWLVITDDQMPVVPLVVAVANRLPGPPVWLTMVAASSWGKSDLVLPVTGLSGVHFISKVTDKTFASGKKRESGDPRHLSLLERFKSEKTWLVAIKDLGTIQSLPPLTRNGIFGQLREIYDGQYSADYGTGVHINWKGKLGVLAAATNVIDDYTKWSAELGERFVYFRLKRTPQALVAARAMKAVDDGVDDGRAKALAAAFAEAFAAADEVVKSNRGCGHSGCGGRCGGRWLGVGRWGPHSPLPFLARLCLAGLQNRGLQVRFLPGLLALSLPQPPGDVFPATDLIMQLANATTPIPYEAHHPPKRPV